MKRLLCLGLILFCSTGCQSILHELQPHRLWRWNYQEPPGRTDGVYYSIDDPLDQPVPNCADASAIDAGDAPAGEES
ncbi:MAG: hypothetical protein R3C19_02895 [Planctomycetaceae bacterium]